MTASKGLLCAVSVRRGDFELDVELAVAPGEILGVIGPNGAGKSTLLGAVAGTLPLEAGRIELDGRLLSAAGGEAEGGRARSLPRAVRRVGLLDQRARLFPHLDAAANIAFGPRARGAARGQARAVALDWLDRVGLPGREGAREGELSGGQQQRVAIARTLASEPRALLLDEPFAALDIASAQGLRALVSREVRALGVPALLVTHDPVDLIALADRVVVLEGGRIAQHGTVAGVLAAPTTPFAAEFAGRVLLRGVATERGTVRLERAPVAEVRGATGGAGLPERDRLPPGRAAVASFDPSEVRVIPLREAGSGPSAALATDEEHTAPLRWSGTVAALAASRTGVRIVCEEWPDWFAEVPVSRALDPALAPGSRVRFELSPAQIVLAAV